ncbi:MAG: polysaccharide deacetylase family protein, partial [Peptococcales bacterium]
LIVFKLFTFSVTPTMQVDPIYQGKTDQPCVSLTINVDWGEDVIPKMLDVLEEKNVKATFFITGRFAKKFPDIVKLIHEKQHEIGNHGYSHPHPDRISVEKNLEEINKTHDILRELTKENIYLFAPPYGERGPNCLKAAQQAGYKTILWTADTIDWQEPPPSVDTLVSRVTEKKLTNGTIILMHPKPHTLEALPLIIDVIKTKGYEIRKVSEII